MCAVSGLGVMVMSSPGELVLAMIIVVARVMASLVNEVVSRVRRESPGDEMGCVPSLALS